MSDSLSSVALRLLGTRDSLADLAAINTTILKNGAMVFVTSERDYYVVVKSATDAASGTQIIAPLAGPGRWFRSNIGASQELFATQADWYVDEQNATGLASDENSGATATAPLLTYTELTRRIQFATLEQTTTVHLLSDVNTTSVFEFRGTVLSPSVLKIEGEAPTVLATLTSAAARNINVNGELRPYVQLGVAWDPALMGKRCRVTATTGATSVDTLFWLEEIDGGDPTICYISQPFRSTNPPAFGFARTLSATGGDTFAVEELTKCGLLLMKMAGGQNTGAGQPYRAAIISCGGVDATGSYATLESDTGIGAYGSHLSWDFFQGRHLNIEGCRFGGAAATGINLICNGPPNAITACSIHKTGTAGVCRMQGTWLTWINCSFVNCRAAVGAAPFGFAAALLHGVNALSFWSWGAGAAITAEPGSGVRLSAKCWGTSAVANTRGLDVGSNSWCEYPSANPPTVAGALANQIIVGGVQDTYANLPAAGQNPGNNNAWLVVSA